MYCSKCGQELHGRFCSNCGYDSRQNGGKFKAFINKVREFFKKIWGVIVANKKLSIIISSAFVVVLTTTIVFVSILTNIYRVSKVKKITIGMPESQIVKILGEPTLEEDNTLYWYEDKISKKIDRIDEIVESVFMDGDFEDLEEVAKEHDKLVDELDKTTYKFIMVKLDYKDRAKEVFLDKNHKYDENFIDYSTTEKELKKAALSKAYVSALQIVDDTGKISELEISSDSKSAVYTAYYKDGSLFRSNTTFKEITPNEAGDQATLKWDDELLEYELTVPMRSTAKISVDGCLLEWYNEEETIVIPLQVNKIASNAFPKTEKIKKVILSNGNIDVDRKAFLNLSSLEYNTYGGGSYLGTEENPYALFVCINDNSVDIVISNTAVGMAKGATDGATRSIFTEDKTKIVYIPEELASPLNLPSDIKNIVVGGDVTKIPSNAFTNSVQLESIIIEDCVETISSRAFSGLKNLKSITIGNGVTNIGSSAFEDCTSLIYNEYDNAYYLGNENNPYVVLVKAKDTSITSCEINSKTKVIYGSAFSGCKGLTSITIPDSVTTIGSSAFWECTSLTSITIPDSVTTIGYYAFSGCRGLTSITIPDSVTSIGWYAFYNCTSLTSINIPNSVTTIGEGAFEDCTSLTSINIPNSVTTIGEGAFRNCTSLTSITIPNSVTSIGSSSFEDCTSLASVTIPDRVTTIGYKAFYGCTSLTSVTIGDSVTTIGEGAFWDCTSLTSVTIPDSVTTIGEGAFWDCTSLTSVTIPDRVTTIGNGAFYGCTSLASITIPDSVTKIGNVAFYGCTSLTSVTIGDSVTTIGEGAFRNCTSLTSITIPNSVTSIGSSSFEDCTSLTSVTIGDSVTSIGWYAFNGCTRLTSIAIPNGVTSIGSEAFCYCPRLIIYCEAESKPSGWNSDWNYTNCPVVWGYKEMN